MGPVAFVSHTNWGGTFRVGSHHLAEQLASRGIDVLHLSTPASLIHRLRDKTSDKVVASSARPIRVGSHLTTFTPRSTLPVQLDPAREVAGVIADWSEGRRCTILLDQPLMATGALRSVADRLVYRPTDLYPRGVAARRQRTALRIADAVVATSDTVLGSLGPTELPSLVLNNGVDFDLFQATAPTMDRNGIAYVGAFDHRFDWEVLMALTAAFPQERFRLIGPLGGSPSLPNNVYLEGPLPYAEVPGALHNVRVGLLPLSSSIENAGRSPMKLYEYLAAGLHVVTRKTPTLHDETPGVHTYESVGGAVEAMDRALNSAPGAGVIAAKEHDWSSRTDQLLEFLDGLPTHGNQPAPHRWHH